MSSRAREGSRALSSARETRVEGPLLSYATDGAVGPGALTRDSRLGTRSLQAITFDLVGPGALACDCNTSPMSSRAREGSRALSSARETRVEGPLLSYATDGALGPGALTRDSRLGTRSLQAITFDLVGPGALACDCNTSPMSSRAREGSRALSSARETRVEGPLLSYATDGALGPGALTRDSRLGLGLATAG